MLKSTQESAGLGSPPSIFTTNTSESLNKAIKQHVHFKPSEWPEFNNKMKNLVSSKREEVIRALSGRRLYRLKPEYVHLGVEQVVWLRKRPDQRKKLIRHFDDSSLLSESITQSNLIASNLIASTQSASTQSNLVASGSSPDCAHISILPTSSGITTLHESVLQGMWDKANKLLSTERGLQRAASSDPTAWTVQSFSSAVPHFVTSKPSGQYLCDPQCPQWISSKICSHTIAVAEHTGKLAAFLSWYVASNQKADITSLGLVNMPKGRGQKGGVPTRKCCRAKATAPEIVVSRLSLQSTSTTVSVSVSPVNTFNSPLSCMGSPTFNNTPYYTVVGSSSSYNLPPVSLYTPTQPSPYSPTHPPPHVYPPPNPYSPLNSPTEQSSNPNPFFTEVRCWKHLGLSRVQGFITSCRKFYPRSPLQYLAERRSYHNSSGNLVTPSSYKPVHYHIFIACLPPDFESLNVGEDMQLTPQHKSFVFSQLSISI